MQESETKLLFDAGNLKSVTVVNAPMSKGYYLQFAAKNGSTIMIEKQRGDLRAFKTLQGAISTAYEIGFRDIRVTLTEAP